MTKVEVIKKIETKIMQGLHAGKLARPDQRESFPGWWVGKKRNRGPWLKHCHALGRTRMRAARQVTRAGVENAGEAQGAKPGGLASALVLAELPGPHAAQLDGVEAPRAAAS